MGHVEFEFGLSYARPNRGGRDAKLPLTSLTLGLSHSLEVGFAIQRVSIDTKGEKALKGLEDLRLNSKYKLLEEDLSLPALSFSLDLKIPTANREKGLTTGRTDESFLLICSKNLDPLAIDLNLGYLLVNSPPGDKLKNRVLGGLAIRWTTHERVVLVGEIFGLSRETKGEKSEANFQVGIRYKLASPLVFDAAIGRSLLPTGNKVQVTLGFTWIFRLSL